MIPLATIIFFVFGAIVGSFLNVVIFRINTRKSFFGSFGGRSACMSCRNQLRWYELVPLLSFLGLRGRCKNCKTKISIQYPLVEITTGLIFACLFLKFSALDGSVLGGQEFVFNLTFIFTYTYYALAFSILLVIAVYDLKHKIIPDALSFLFGALAFAGLFFFHTPDILNFLSGIFIAAPFALFWLVSGGRWMGLGDAKLALGIGWLLGISLSLSSLVLAFWTGAVVGIFLIIFSKIKRMAKFGMKSEIPFAPFLVLGAFLAFIFGLNFFGI